jgi:Tol biopolymer transport system component
MRERDALRRVVLAVALVTSGTVMLGVGACGGDGSLMEKTAVVSPAPASPAIAFTFGGGGIYAIRPDGSGRVRLTAGRTDPDVGTGDADPAWSPDGATLAFVRTIRLGFEEFHSQVYLLGPGQGRPRPLTAGVDGVSVSGPAWSPDGERIAHVRDTDSETAIVVAEVDGGGEQVLRREPYDIEGDRNHLWQPAWSPDAARIAYTLSRLDRRSHFRTSLHTMNTAGGDVRLLAREASDAAWSPDGRRIAFVSVRDRNGETCYDQCNYHGELYVMDADGTDPVRLTRNRGDDRSPSWSPDGRRIAFASDRNYPDGRSPEIYSIRPDGSCLTWLTNGSSGSADPAWRNAPRTSTDPGGCGAMRRRPLVQVELQEVRAFNEHPVYWLGKRYGDLLLSYAEAGRDVGLVYDDCASFHPRDCPAPIQLQESSVCSRNTTLTAVNDPSHSFSGVFAARSLLFIDLGQGDLSAITGRTDVRIFPNSKPRSRALAAARRLRPLGKRAQPLPPPALPRPMLHRVRRTERAVRRLGSVAAVTRALGIPREAVRDRLRLGRAVRSLPRVRAVACQRP